MYVVATFIMRNLFTTFSLAACNKCHTSRAHGIRELLESEISDLRPLEDVTPSGMERIRYLPIQPAHLRVPRYAAYKWA